MSKENKYYGEGEYECIKVLAARVQGLPKRECHKVPLPGREENRGRQ